MLTKFTELLNRLVVHADIMKKNLDRSRGLVFSQAVLLKMIEKGFTRIEAYNFAQQAAMEVYKSDIDFMTAARRHVMINSALSKEDMEECFDIKAHLKHVNRIFRKVGI
jgi:adenylosuccinate lyase